MERSTEFETEYDNRSHFEQEFFKERNYISFKFPVPCPVILKSSEKDELPIDLNLKGRIDSDWTRFLTIKKIQNPDRWKVVTDTVLVSGNWQGYLHRTVHS